MSDLEGSAGSEYGNICLELLNCLLSVSAHGLPLVLKTQRVHDELKESGFTVSTFREILPCTSDPSMPCVHQAGEEIYHHD